MRIVMRARDVRRIDFGQAGWQTCYRLPVWSCGLSVSEPAPCAVPKGTRAAKGSEPGSGGKLPEGTAGKRPVTRKKE
jgi:hypothetical protein